MDRDAQGNIIINREGIPWQHWSERDDPSPFDTYEMDKSKVARKSTPFTAFLATAKEVEKESIHRKPAIRYGPSRNL